MTKKLKKWKLLEETDVSPSSWFPVYKHKVKLPNGRIVDDYYISKLGDVVMVLPITINGDIVFVKQYKHGVGNIIVELPAGRIKPEYSIEKNATLELEEETGYKANKLVPLGTLYGEPSKDTYRVFGYVAADLEEQVEQKLDENEDIEVLHVPVYEIDNFIKNGNISSPDTIAFIKLAQLKFPKLFN